MQKSVKGDVIFEISKEIIEIVRCYVLVCFGIIYFWGFVQYRLENLIIQKR